jgi:hypothetical protein
MDVKLNSGSRIPMGGRNEFPLRPGALITEEELRIIKTASSLKEAIRFDEGSRSRIMLETLTEEEEGEKQCPLCFEFKKSGVKGSGIDPDTPADICQACYERHGLGEVPGIGAKSASTVKVTGFEEPFAETLKKFILWANSNPVKVAGFEGWTGLTAEAGIFESVKNLIKVIAFGGIMMLSSGCLTGQHCDVGEAYMTTAPRDVESNKDWILANYGDTVGAQLINQAEEFGRRIVSEAVEGARNTGRPSEDLLAADPSQYERMFAEIINNAVKAAPGEVPEGMGRLYVYDNDRFDPDNDRFDPPADLETEWTGSAGDFGSFTQRGARALLWIANEVAKKEAKKEYNSISEFDEGFEARGDDFDYEKFNKEFEDSERRAVEDPRYDDPKKWEHPGQLLPLLESKSNNVVKVAGFEGYKEGWEDCGSCGEPFDASSGHIDCEECRADRKALHEDIEERRLVPEEPVFSGPDDPNILATLATIKALGDRGERVTVYVLSEAMGGDAEDLAKRRLDELKSLGLVSRLGADPGTPERTRSYFVTREGLKALEEEKRRERRLHRQREFEELTDRPEM